MAALKRLALRIIAESPLLLGGPHAQGNYLETRGYLPGAALRGALARALLEDCAAREYIRDHDHCLPLIRDNCPFHRLFCHGYPPLFDNSYPSNGERSFPLPLTARTCKAHPGFKDLAKPQEPHGVFDTLVRRLVFEEAVEAELRLAFLYWPPRCPQCHGGTMPLSGFYEKGPKGAYLSPRAATDRLSRTAINRARSVAEEAMLYTIQTIEAGTRFQGSVVVDGDKQALLEESLRRVGWLGRGNSRGLGRVRIELLGQEEGDKGDLEARVTAFNRLVEEERRLYYKIDGRPQKSVESPAAEGWYFVLDLLSPAILTSDGLPTLHPGPKGLGLSEGVTLTRPFARPTAATGWFSAAGLPRRTQLATAMGSVFVYQVKEERDREQVLERLALLEMEGIGQERERGYGQITVCSLFHTEVEAR